MATEEYGIVVGDIEEELPELPAFAATTVPTTTQVTSRITRVSEDVNAVVNGQGVSTDSVLADDEAKGWVRTTIILGVAAWAARSRRGATGKRADKLEQMFESRVDRIRDEPEVVLSGAWSSSNARGTRTHDATNPAANVQRQFHYAQPRRTIF